LPPSMVSAPAPPNSGSSSSLPSTRSRAYSQHGVIKFLGLLDRGPCVALLDLRLGCACAATSTSTFWSVEWRALQPHDEYAPLLVEGPMLHLIDAFCSWTERGRCPAERPVGCRPAFCDLRTLGRHCSLPRVPDAPLPASCPFVASWGFRCHRPLAERLNAEIGHRQGRRPAGMLRLGRSPGGAFGGRPALALARRLLRSVSMDILRGQWDAETAPNSRGRKRSWWPQSRCRTLPRRQDAATSRIAAFAKCLKPADPPVPRRQASRGPVGRRKGGETDLRCSSAGCADVPVSACQKRG
jgi:hypothetical protein